MAFHEAAVAIAETNSIFKGQTVGDNQILFRSGTNVYRMFLHAGPCASLRRMPTLLSYFRLHKQLGKQKIKPKYLVPDFPLLSTICNKLLRQPFSSCGGEWGVKSQNIPLNPTVLWFGTTWWQFYDSHLNIRKRFRLLTGWDLQTPPATVSALSA